MFAVFTVCNLAYLPKALALAESLQKYDRVKLKVYLVDRRVELDSFDNCVELIWTEEIGVPNYYQLAFMYDITEFSTSLKPYIALSLLEQFEKVVFLDADTLLYSSVQPILQDLNSHSIVLTPHYVTPQSDALPDSDVGMMRFGSFNLGFFAVRGSAQSKSFLEWWNDRCMRYCFFETQFGLSTDQKWVSIAPCFFQDIHISRNLGYNVAFWNVHERHLHRTADGIYFVNGEYPLIFFHFSSFDEAVPGNLSKRPFADKNKQRIDLLEVSIAYQHMLTKKRTSASLIPYGFDYMSNGEYVSPTLRRGYACVRKELSGSHDPFDSLGVVGDFARKNHLFEREATPYLSNSFSDMGQHKIKFVLIYMLMRMILRVLGPNKFMNFSRLLVYLSSFRQTRGLWKL